MKRNQKVVLQEQHGGLHIWTGRRTVYDLEDHGEYWTGTVSVHGRTYEVQLTSVPGQIDTWYAQVGAEHSAVIHSLGAEIK